MSQNTKLNEYTQRVNDLLSIADDMLKTAVYSAGERSVDITSFYNFKTASLSLIRSIYSEEHPFYHQFNVSVHRSITTSVEIGKGILNAAKKEIENGWLFSIKGIIAAEIFSDFLEMAEYLLSEGFKDPAAVMIGSVLEEHLRQLCKKHNIDIEYLKDGKPYPKKADTLNSELSTAKVYSKLDQKNITSNLGLRNSAAHGKYNEYNKEQVEIMKMSVAEFISRIN